VNRVFVVLLALGAIPGVASVAQDRPAFDPHSLKPASGSRPVAGSDNPGLGHDAAHCAMRAALHPGAEINKCAAPVTEPPPPPPPTPSATCGSAPVGGSIDNMAIDGQVYEDFAPWNGLGDWCIQLTGPVSGAVTTDAAGFYRFSGLPAGTYTVCEVLQTNWRESFPGDGAACPGGFGYTITFDPDPLYRGTDVGYIQFGNVTP